MACQCDPSLEDVTALRSKLPHGNNPALAQRQAPASPMIRRQDYEAATQLRRSRKVGGSYVMPAASRFSSRRVDHSSIGPSIVEYQALLFRPEIQEVVEGAVVEIRKFGAFVRFGPLDGLLHVSQIMDDRVNIDEHNQRLVGVETKRDLKVGYKARARVVSLSLSEISPRDSRIGLTMRQPGLGRLEWIQDAHKKTEEKTGKKPAKKEPVAKPATPAKAAAPAAAPAPPAEKAA